MIRLIFHQKYKKNRTFAKRRGKSVCYKLHKLSHAENAKYAEVFDYQPSALSA